MTTYCFNPIKYITLHIIVLMNPTDLLKYYEIRYHVGEIRPQRTGCNNAHIWPSCRSEGREICFNRSTYHRDSWLDTFITLILSVLKLVHSFATNTDFTSRVILSWWNKRLHKINDRINFNIIIIVIWHSARWRIKYITKNIWSCTLNAFAVDSAKNGFRKFFPHPHHHRRQDPTPFIGIRTLVREWGTRYDYYGTQSCLTLYNDHDDEDDNDAYVIRMFTFNVCTV